ncbi:MAG: selenide, water dikinase SelD [Caldilineaceae bacterium]|nr:selenide, water dikinase SelD [Caldilineaceae bacterium]
MRQIANLFPAEEHAEVLIGLGEPDDAAVYRLDEERALIKTTDFFTPIVDDPWTYGAIAAVNAMSDVYAMGGEVLFCLNIAGFPETLDLEIVARIFAGGAFKVREAGAAIAGGHTVTNPEPFYGLSVTGIVHPDQIMRKGGAQAGDRLFLTKPLGTGVITTAAKLAGESEGTARRLLRKAQGKIDLDVRHLDAAIASMMRLNRAGARAAREANVRSATDITGFGLLGHASEMAVASAQLNGVGFRIRAGDVPTLPGVFDYLKSGYLTRGSTRNPDHYGAHVHMDTKVSDLQRTLLWEAETSGGLLLCVPAAGVETFRSACAGADQPCWEIGEVAADLSGIEVVGSNE